MKYNKPPIPMSSELKDVLQSSLGLTEAGLMNTLSKYDDNYCFGTLNQEAVLLKCDICRAPAGALQISRRRAKANR